jgi:hypothetical protein
MTTNARGLSWLEGGCGGAAGRLGLLAAAAASAAAAPATAAGVPHLEATQE